MYHRLSHKHNYSRRQNNCILLHSIHIELPSNEMFVLCVLCVSQYPGDASVWL